MIRLSILIPSYNEFNNLKVLIPEILGALKNVSYDYELIIVDRVELDYDTSSLCRQLGANYVNRTGGNKYGDAVRTGIQSSTGQIIIFMDADGSHDPCEIPKLMELVDQCDIVVSSRYISLANSQNPYIKELGSLFLNWLCRIVLNINCKDVSNSFKAYRGDDLRKLNLVSDNIDIIEEMVYKLVNYNENYKILEIPGNFRKRINYTSRREPLLYFISYVKTIFNLKFKH